MTTTTPTKADELTTFRRFVESLPDGYLRDILAEAEPAVKQAIRSDFAGPWILTDALHATAAARDELAELQTAIARARQELERIGRQTDKARDMLADLRTTAQHIAERIPA